MNRWVGRADVTTRDLERIDGPGAYAFYPWLLLAVGPARDVLVGSPSPRWLAAAGLGAFAVLYVLCVRFAFSDGRRWLSSLMVAALGMLAAVLAAVYGGDWFALFPLLAIASGVGVVGQPALLALAAITIAGALLAWQRGAGLGEISTVSYMTFLSGLVTAVMLRLFVAFAELRRTREQLAEAAVAEERLRFARDLHDLLGHTLSVIVVKAEAIRRLLPRDQDAALGQAADIEAVGRQALREVREAVTGYREQALGAELDRARSALEAAGIELAVHESGPTLASQTEALLGWVIREGVTNVIRHSGARHCEIDLRHRGDEVGLEIRDDGGGRPAAAGSGLRGLRERVAAAGGRLDAGDSPAGGFRLAATLPAPPPEDS